jgi:endonuclease III
MDRRHRELRDYLVARGQELLDAPREPVIFSGNPDADDLMNDLRRHPHAFVFGCLVDRRVPAERAWELPAVLRDRLGGFEFERLAALGEADWLTVMRTPTPAHRMPETMATVLFRGTQRLADHYRGRASRIWASTPSSATLIRRFLEFYGIGPKIGNMAANILVRNFKVPLSDYRYVDISADVQVARVMARLGFVEEGASTDVVIYAARELNPDFPGIFDLVLWEIGRTVCRPRNPDCDSCELSRWCSYARARG